MNKVAILIGTDCEFTFEIAEFQEALNTYDIESCVFTESESILEYKPSCVIVTSPSNAKLTPYPTFGVLNLGRSQFLALPRYIRNALTYDGYLIQSPIITQTLGDLIFGARKINSQTISMNFYPLTSEYRAPNLKYHSRKLVIFEPNYDKSRYKNAIKKLLKSCNSIYLATNQRNVDKIPSNRIISFESHKNLSTIFDENTIAICLSSGDDGNISTALMKCVSLSVPVIARESEVLKLVFGDRLSYIPNAVSLSALPQLIELMVNQIYLHNSRSSAHVYESVKIVNEKYALATTLPVFINMYSDTLINKGYLPKHDVDFEKKLPSVTYIMRTGGKHRPFLERALDCLVAQQYPDMRVIFVTHIKVDFLPEIIEKYPGIQFKVIESIKSKRSQAIRDGMAAVETDLFGLFDDDDELFPNHVRSLVYTMEYHNHRDWRGEIGMVYSASIHADDTYPVAERAEFRDYKLSGQFEKRAIEHYRYYNSNMMSMHNWFMPNGWLARTSLIDNEILTDPGLDTCEDLYFELQIAQKSHFAFSGEVTAIHHFHHLGNSTIDDSHKHLPDTQRIALRNFSRTFPADANYDIADKFWLIGKQIREQTWVRFADESPNLEVDYTVNQFYPGRAWKPSFIVSHQGVNYFAGQTKLKSFVKTVILPLKLVGYFIKFFNLEKSRKDEYMNKFLRNVEENGVLRTLFKIHHLIERGQVAEFTLDTKHSFLYKGLKRFFTLFGVKIMNNV